MKILVLGSGAREHALCWKIAQSPLLTRLYCAPGNPGTATCSQNVPIAAERISELLSFAQKEKIDLVVVGPEQPLAFGIVDEFRHAGVKIVGPTREAAKLESSKWYAKEVLNAGHVATARAAVFQSKEAFKGYVAKREPPFVLKADGLAAGKGVCVCQNRADVDAAIPHLFDVVKASTIVVEDMLQGQEVSFIIATNGRDVQPLASSHDYKRIFDGDMGPNTGGMGAVSPSPRLSSKQAQAVIVEVVAPVLKEMERRGTPFSGFLYVGLMISPEGIANVLEFNTRLGDPECQVIMRRMRSDIVPLLLGLAEFPATKPLPNLEWDERSAICIVQAARGYPGTLTLGDDIEGCAFAGSVPEVVVFHAGTAAPAPNKIVTSGGRVLSVTSLGATTEEARSLGYRASDMIQFRGKQVRRDIGIQ